LLEVLLPKDLVTGVYQHLASPAQNPGIVGEPRLSLHQLSRELVGLVKLEVFAHALDLETDSINVLGAFINESTEIGDSWTPVFFLNVFDD